MRLLAALRASGLTLGAHLACSRGTMREKADFAADDMILAKLKK